MPAGEPIDGGPGWTVQVAVFVRERVGKTITVRSVLPKPQRDIRICFTDWQTGRSFWGTYQTPRSPGSPRGITALAMEPICLISTAT
jgi:hypothetical protein